MKTKILLFVMGLLITTQLVNAQVPTYVPTNGLVGYWPFSGNANDESGNGNNGLENNMIYDSDRNGNINSCLNINGNTNRWIDVAISNQTSVNQQSKTFSMWIKLPTSYSGISYYNHIITPTNLPWMQVLGNYPTYISSGNINKFVFNGQMPVSNQQFNDNLWHNIIVVCDDNFNMKLYLDGLLVGNQSFPNSNNFTNLNQIRIGNNIGNLSECAFAGQIDDIGIWDRALSQQEITNMYNGVAYSDTCNAVSGSLTQGLVGYWPFCGNANDDSGNGHNGTVNGATLTTDRFGNSNSAYSFDGVNDFISTSYSGILGNNSRSISFWYNGISNNIGETVFTDYGGGNNNGEGFACTLFPLNQPAVDNTGSWIKSVNSTTINNWNFYTVTYSSLDGSNLDNCKIYINGVLQSTSQSSPVYDINTINGVNMVFGSSRFFDPIQFFNGKLDDIGIWNRALTQQEITQLFNQNQCITNITVTDTLIINVGQLSYTNPVSFANNITIYPNPASTQVNISFNNITDLAGGSIKIINSLGQQVATTPITATGTNTTMALNSWGGTGLYFVQILNAQGQILDIKKIILQ
jgi:hypothetical protein